MIGLLRSFGGLSTQRSRVPSLNPCRPVTERGLALSAERELKSLDQRLALIPAEVCFRVQSHVVRLRHLSLLHLVGSALSVSLRTVELGEVNLTSSLFDVSLDQPGDWCHIAVPGPLNLVTVAGEAGPYRQFTGPWIVPGRLNSNRRIGVDPAVGDELYAGQGDDDGYQTPAQRHFQHNSRAPNAERWPGSADASLTYQAVARLLRNQPAGGIMYSILYIIGAIVVIIVVLRVLNLA
jgi:hypothetical protein